MSDAQPCGCGETLSARVLGEQHAVRWRAWYVDGAEYDCRTGIAFDELPDDGCLGVKVFFNDGTTRVCSGDDWYAMLRTPDGYWTIMHNSHAADENARRYPDVRAWKRGHWTSEAEMQRVNTALMSAE